MKKIIYSAIIALVAVVVPVVLSSCVTDSSVNGADTVTEPQPLNITVYLDLSNRLVKSDPSAPNLPMNPPQAERDMTLIHQLIESFIAQCQVDGIPESKNHFQVFFYPYPEDTQIATFAEKLDTDLAALPREQKKRALMGMQENYGETLSSIYASTLSTKNWIGCDIWSFFNSNKIDNLCIRDGYRNILVIVTDGYIYDIHNVKKLDGKYTYIPESVASSQHTLAVNRKGLDNLEVLVVEVNPVRSEHFQVLTEIWTNWLEEMEVKKYAIIETDLPSNNKQAVKKFIQSN